MQSLFIEESIIIDQPSGISPKGIISEFHWIHYESTRFKLVSQVNFCTVPQILFFPELRTPMSLIKASSYDHFLNTYFGIKSAGINRSLLPRSLLISLISCSTSASDISVDFSTAISAASNDSQCF